MARYSTTWDKVSREVDNVFIREFRKGRHNGLSLDDAIRSATNSAMSRIKTIQERGNN